MSSSPAPGLYSSTQSENVGAPGNPSSVIPADGANPAEVATISLINTVPVNGANGDSTLAVPGVGMAK